MLTNALAQRLASNLRESRDRRLKLAPKHAGARIALRPYQAEIVGEVRAIQARPACGAKARDAERHLERALKLTPSLPIA